MIKAFNSNGKIIEQLDVPSNVNVRAEFQSPLPVTRKQIERKYLAVSVPPKVINEKEILLWCEGYLASKKNNKGGGSGGGTSSSSRPIIDEQEILLWCDGYLANKSTFSTFSTF
jgi:hypothetical protein